MVGPPYLPTGGEHSHHSIVLTINSLVFHQNYFLISADFCSHPAASVDVLDGKLVGSFSSDSD